MIIYPFDGKLIPIEVKSGTEGKLKSLHLFMKEAPHGLAVRVYAGTLNIQKIALEGKVKKYRLLNLPYYLVSQIERYIEWFQNEVK